MRNQDTVRIPLRARDGSVRAYAVVDAADAEWVNRWRWSIDNGYAAARHWVDRKGKKVYLHRMLMGLVRGDGKEVDHRDRNRLNCTRSNLRVTTRTGNRQNRGSLSGSSSSYRGVSWLTRERKWFAFVKTGGVMHRGGYFDSEQQAGLVARFIRAQMLPNAAD